MLRTTLAVLAGYVLFFGLMQSTDVVASLLFPALGPHAAVPPSYMMISLSLALVWAVAGGWLCAVIARERRQPAMLALIILGELVGLVFTVALWKASSPHWYGIGLLLMYPPAVWLGSRMKRQQARMAAAESFPPAFH